MVVVVTGGEQSNNEGIGDAVKREITQGLQEGHGADKGIAAACLFFNFKTCEGIILFGNDVRCMAC